jgi:PiT family inorganic phosphate transporter
LKTNYANQLQDMLDDHEGEEKVRLQKFLSNFQSAAVEDMEKMLKQAKLDKAELGLKKAERKKMKKLYSEKLVKRSAVKKIVAAWIITVPASATLAAGVFFMLHDLPLG